MGTNTRALLTGIMMSLVAACTTATAPPPKDQDLGPEFTDKYVIGFGDTLAVDVYRHADLSVSVLVRPDGKITVPVAGDITVGGQTPEQVSKVIAKALSDYIRDPIVTTTIAGMGSNEFLTRIRVTGAVGSPSSMPYRQGITILDAILESGGVTEFSNPAKTVLYRSDGERIKIRLDRILKGGDMSTNYTLKPGDMLTVPERIF